MPSRPLSNRSVFFCSSAVAGSSVYMHVSASNFAVFRDAIACSSKYCFTIVLAVRGVPVGGPFTGGRRRVGLCLSMMCWSGVKLSFKRPSSHETSSSLLEADIDMLSPGWYDSFLPVVSPRVSLGMKDLKDINYLRPKRLAQHQCVKINTYLKVCLAPPSLMHLRDFSLQQTESGLLKTSWEVPVEASSWWSTASDTMYLHAHITPSMSNTHTTTKCSGVLHVVPNKRWG